MRRGSGAGASLTPSACATSMMSGFGSPPPPPVTLTSLLPSICSAEAGGAMAWRTLAVVSGAGALCGAGKISTFATANGSPLSAKSRLRKRQEAGDYRENRDADGRPFRRALAPNGRRSWGAGSKTERFVQFVPHCSRRLSFRTAQARQSTLPEPILRNAAGDRLLTPAPFVLFSPLLRLDAGCSDPQRRPTMKHE